MEFTKPAEIERESMRIIDGELLARGIALPEETKAVVKRVIHTTADFDYAENLRFTPDAVKRALAALRGGATIITDTNMALAGVSKIALQKLGGTVRCFMAEPFIAEDARARGVTRAVASMDYASENMPDAIYAVGNAPTALLRLAEHIESGMRPALVIGVPVGFVNVVESKERALAVCEAHGVPAIVALGRKGGSNVAAAICNALLYAAAELAEPERRGGV
ncbi:MAG: precorrin-8X methylmutase [Ruminococcaceae bacterium]|nr:precorrin-8X methylmutase [Oscillospiraceae bacterium]